MLELYVREALDRQNARLLEAEQNRMVRLAQRGSRGRGLRGQMAGRIGDLLVASGRRLQTHR
jgi:hypothetical protein